MGTFRLRAARGVVARELTVDGDVFVLFEWPSASVAEPSGLTAAQRDVLAGILRSESNATIARRRGTNERTVGNQVAALFRKLGVGSRSELVARLTRSGD